MVDDLDSDSDSGKYLPFRPLSTPNPDPTVLTTYQLKREIEGLRTSLVTRIESVQNASGEWKSSLQAIFESKLEAIRTFYDAAVSSIRAEVLTRGQMSDTKIDGQRDVIFSRIDSMEKAVQLLQNISDRIPAQMDDKVSHLRNLHQEKFDSISTQFVERDVRTEQTAAGVKIAVDAALQAAKEAVGEQNRSFALATAKSEAATTKQIDAQALSIQTAYKGLDDKIIDMKDRLTRIEAMGLGVATQKTEQQIQYRDTMTMSQSTDKNNLAIISIIISILVGVSVVVLGLIHIQPNSNQTPSVVYALPPGTSPSPSPSPSPSFSIPPVH